MHRTAGVVALRWTRPGTRRALPVHAQHKSDRRADGHEDFSAEGEGVSVPAVWLHVDRTVVIVRGLLQIPHRKLGSLKEVVSR